MECQHDGMYILPAAGNSLDFGRLFSDYHAVIFVTVIEGQGLIKKIQQGGLDNGVLWQYYVDK